MNLAKLLIYGGVLAGIVALVLSFVMPMMYIIIIGFLALVSGVLPLVGIMMYQRTAPTAFKYADAKMAGKKVLWIFREDRTIVPEAVTFDSGKMVLDSGVPVIIDSPEDIYILDGVPTAIMFRPIGKTLDPQKLLAVRELERAGYDKKSFKKEMERIAFENAFNGRYQELLSQGVSPEDARKLAINYAKTEMENPNRMPRSLKVKIGGSRIE